MIFLKLSGVVFVNPVVLSNEMGSDLGFERSFVEFVPQGFFFFFSPTDASLMRFESRALCLLANLT